MVRIQHTEWPVGRKPISNEVRPGGLWYRDEQEQLLNQAKRLARKKPKDEWKEFAKWFWAGTAIITLIIFFFLNNHK